MADVFALVAGDFGLLFATMTSFVMSVAFVAVFIVFENRTRFGIRGRRSISGMICVRFPCTGAGLQGEFCLESRFGGLNGLVLFHPHAITYQLCA